MAKKKAAIPPMAKALLKIAENSYEESFKTADEAEEAVDEAREELEEKIAKKKEKLKIAQHRKELQKINKLSEILDCETYEEAMAMAETDEEKTFVEENFKL